MPPTIYKLHSLINWLLFNMNKIKKKYITQSEHFQNPIKKIEETKVKSIQESSI